MELNALVSKVNEIGKGNARVTTRTEVKLLKRACKAAGYNKRIYKTTAKNVELGLNYEELPEVKEYKATHEVKESPVKFTYLVENTVAYNENQNSHYLVYFKSETPNPVTTYSDELGNAVEYSEFEGFLSKSASNGIIPITQKVKVENVISLEKV